MYGLYEECHKLKELSLNLSVIEEQQMAYVCETDFLLQTYNTLQL